MEAIVVLSELSRLCTYCVEYFCRSTLDLTDDTLLSHASAFGDMALEVSVVSDQTAVVSS
jgi:hypothetical protein